MNSTDPTPYIALLVLIFSGLLTYVLLKRFPWLYWGKTHIRPVTTQQDWHFLSQRELRIYRKRLCQFLGNTQTILDSNGQPIAILHHGHAKEFYSLISQLPAVPFHTNPIQTGQSGTVSPEK